MCGIDSFEVPTQFLYFSGEMKSILAWDLVIHKVEKSGFYVKSILSIWSPINCHFILNIWATLNFDFLRSFDSFKCKIFQKSFKASEIDEIAGFDFLNSAKIHFT